MKLSKILALSASCAALSQAYAADVNITAIYGAGNGAGGWTAITSGDVQLGLRAKVRYDVADDQPKDIYNSDGNGTYTMAAGSPLSNPTRARWNFDWSINSNADGIGTRNLSDMHFVLGVDNDISQGTSFHTIDLLSAPADHSFGNNSTLSGQGAEAANAGAFATLVSTSNVAQNSVNLDFIDGSPLFPGLFNPGVDATYSFFLEAYDATGAFVARTAMTVVVGNGGAAVPEPASLALVGLALLGATAASRRRA